MTAFTKTLAAAALVTATGLFITMGAARADTWDILREDSRISSGLTVIAVGRHIQGVCPDIDARLVRALAFAEGLVSHARDLGVSRSEVNAYIDDRAEQDRYRDIARRYFQQNGADWDDAASVCQLGRDEIAAGSTIGRLLRGG